MTIAKKKTETRPVPFRLEESDSGGICVTTTSMALLNAVLDRRHEKHPDKKLKLYDQGVVWTEGVPHVIKHQLGRRNEDAG